MTTSFLNTYINSFCLHNVGNKANDDGIKLSKKEIDVDNELKELLTHYFVSAFKKEEYNTLYHDTDINMNEVYTYVSNIFDNPDTINEQSINLAKHLYEQSNHIKIKGGEFYVVYFKDCITNGEIVDAVGLFKSENKDTFLKVYPSGDGFDIESQQGVNINKLDKGALIFNTDRENGYIVAVVDNTNKGSEAHYWIDDFLHIKQRQDDYYNTNSVLSMCKNFVKKELPKHFEVTKADEADFLNKSVQFFKENETFDMGEFVNDVIEQPTVIESFNQFRDNYEQERDIEISDNFTISNSALKKQTRLMKSVIKLDKNFHIYVHGNSNLIEQGEDDKGKFYKVYFNEEN